MTAVARARTGIAILLAACLGFALLLAAPFLVNAAKRATGTTAIVLTVDRGTPGLSYGDSVVIAYTTNSTTFVQPMFECSQNGTVVGIAHNSFEHPPFDGISQERTLNSPAWTGGAAECIAYLRAPQGSRWRSFAESTFEVAA